eukprot:COSAG02_NODE_7168_length_3141_cov_1.577581_2_plen_187_part_00
MKVDDATVVKLARAPPYGSLLTTYSRAVPAGRRTRVAGARRPRARPPRAHRERHSSTAAVAASRTDPLSRRSANHRAPRLALANGATRLRFIKRSRVAPVKWLARSKCIFRTVQRWSTCAKIHLIYHTSLPCTREPCLYRRPSASAIAAAARAFAALARPSFFDFFIVGLALPVPLLLSRSLALLF